MHGRKYDRILNSASLYELAPYARHKSSDASRKPLNLASSYARHKSRKPFPSADGRWETCKIFAGDFADSQKTMHYSIIVNLIGYIAQPLSSAGSH